MALTVETAVAREFAGAPNVTRIAGVLSALKPVLAGITAVAVIVVLGGGSLFFGRLFTGL